ncbi:MAG TPA: SRPBCC family protein [Vicinamibacterales bacterium]|nr:SRPBCC family protein [Vicinamibacterales bacterium]
MQANRSNDYHFVTRWKVAGTCEEVSDVLGDPLDLPRWWPMVYLQVEELRPGGRSGIGRRVRLLTKGKLPYRLRWEFEVVESRYPHGFAIEAEGDFEGAGAWTFTQHGPDVDILFDWRIRAEKPLLRWLSFVMKPIFAANHRWAMARGEECLARELSRRRGQPLRPTSTAETTTR